MHIKTIVGFLLVAAVATTAVAFAKGEKSTICHIPQGNPENVQTITVGVKAADKHLAEHEGDYKGECRKQATEETACAIMTDIVKSYTDDRIPRAISLALDLQTSVARVSPTTADLYYTKATLEQQYQVQNYIVSMFTKTACGGFCNGTVDPKTGETTCSSDSYAGVFKAAVGTIFAVNPPDGTEIPGM